MSICIGHGVIINIITSWYWVYIESAEQSRTAEPNKIDS